MKRKSQQGIALVITLILLSVITFMAVTFLAVSQRERTAVTIESDKTDAKLASDTALERAKAAMIVPIMAYSNDQAFHLRVSTNYINPLGFEAPLAANGNRFTNINYDFTTAKKNLKPLNGAQMEQNIANLLYDPRPPVFIRTNGAPRGVSDFRYYLDLNRNGRFDPSGFLPATNNFGQPLLDAGGAPVTNFFTGDPEWVGVLERPEFPHSASNKFSARWAYIVLPAGAALDLNYIHNQTLADRRLKNDGYQRDQGFGTWEINLAAFLADLNTNVWNPPTALYQYRQPQGFPNTGTAFDDALSLLGYRYANNMNSLMSVANLFGPVGANAFRRDFIDGYGNNRPPVNTVLAPTIDNDDPTRPWPGADSVNHFFTTQEFFDPAKTSPAFINRLNAASQGRSSYNQYTYYRMLSQLTTDSAPEPATKMNLNYDNLVQKTNGIASATNFFAWRPVDFFTNAADRMLLSAANLTTANISIYPTNQYTPAVHRLLQLAANMYDATTNRAIPGATTYPYLPSIFRPRFGINGTNIYIAEYVEETRGATLLLSTPVRDLRNPADRAALLPDDFVYGVPLVIGAKKGFPNFNQYSMQSVVGVTRKLELRRPNVYSRPNETNQMYVLGISNVFAVEAWNSYTNPFPRDLDLYVTNDLSIVLTNEYGVIRSTNMTLHQIISVAVNANTWQGLVNPQTPQQSFRIPLLTNVMFLSNSVYTTKAKPGGFRSAAIGFDRGIGFPVPKWGLSITNNRLRYALVDRATQRPVDYVNLSGMEPHLDITRELMGNYNVRDESSVMGNQWRTNRPNNATSDFAPTVGIINQLEVSLGNQPVNDADWNSYSLQSVSGLDKLKAIEGFRAFFKLSSSVVNSNLVQQAPFTPSRKIYHRTSWEANDPLVHYTLGDLTDLMRSNNVSFVTPPSQPVPPLTNLSTLNERYQPWGGNPKKTPDMNAYNLALKDPLVTRSDDWEFPTNKLPNVGWLGRVHRGTPWQTIYLKSARITDPLVWQKWTGNGLTLDAAVSMPVNDWYLLDLFTVAPNDNASRGQLSVNNSELAGWSAVLSGVIVLTNATADKELNTAQPVRVDPLTIEPAGTAGTNAPLWRIVDGINRERVRKDNIGKFIHVGGSFQTLGEFLATPELTVASPYLNLTNSTQLQKGLSDPVYERIPQQILSLLKTNDQRFVIYSYGQSLKPANNSVVQSGPFSGLVTNYQITGESATRTVLRFEGDPKNPHAVVESFNVLPPE